MRMVWTLRSTGEGTDIKVVAQNALTGFVPRPRSGTHVIVGKPHSFS